MEGLLYVVFIVVAVLIIYGLFVYNKLVKLDNLVKEAFSTMDVYLKKRWDLVPNIVEVVKEFSKYEKETLEEVVRFRNENYEELDGEKKLRLNKKMEPGIVKLMALSESYPDLKASKNYVDLSNELSKIEEDIANSRKYYNGAVRMMNDKVGMFPSNIIAKLCGFKVKQMFEIDESSRESVNVEL